MTTPNSNQKLGSDPGPATVARADGDEDRSARVALTWLAEPGNRTIWSLVQQHGAPATLDQAIRGDLPDPALRNVVLARIADAGDDPRRITEAMARRANRVGARIVIPGDEEWPTRIDALATLEVDEPGRANPNMPPPLCLWVRGEWPLRETLDRSVAVVGARAATAYGVQVASDIAGGLTERGWTIVAGGAFGVDAAAHRAALAAGGRTVAVLPCGVDRPYPVANATMFDQIAQTGLLVSAWPPEAEPLKHRFHARNRLVAAATAGTVVVEAAIRSGSAQMTTTVLALGRVAMVVPGPVTSAMSTGSHELLRSHPQVRLVTGVAHILEELGHSGGDPGQVGHRPG